ncbi:Eaa protein [Salmonella enterica subsp. enterica serovar Hadar str. ATCC 51956]|nr:hypothetical protein [Salmonella enterica]ESH02084.1 Eaa protein [Salmonella enterica subsp. enterica serovar Hadar str. ATCC 51956]SUG91027.1 phage protein [Salmonella enterica subsp. enterica]
MTTITKEEVKAFIEQIESDLSNGWEAQIFELKLARIALASLEAEKGADPVVFTDERNLHHIARGRETSLIWGKQNQEVGDIPLYRHAQPVPVDKEFIPKNLDKALGVVGVALPESKEEFNFQIERWIQRLIDRVIRYADEFKEQPVPVVPEKMSKHALFEVAIARFSKMNEGFPIKRFKADWVISWMLENFPPVAQKQGDN